jgi:hypothetical protein
VVETDFMRAYNLARSRMSDDVWDALDRSVRRIAIYQAMRTLDEEATRRAAYSAEGPAEDHSAG